MHFYIDKYNRLKIDNNGKDPKPTAEQEAFSAKRRTYREAFSEHEFQHDLEDENEEMEMMDFDINIPKRLKKKIKIDQPIINVNESMNSVSEYQSEFKKVYTKQQAPPLKHTTITIHKDGCIVIPEPIKHQKTNKIQKKMSDIIDVSTHPVHSSGFPTSTQVTSAQDPGPMVLSSLRSNACIKIHNESHVVIWRAQKILVVNFPELPKASEASFNLYYRKPSPGTSWELSSYNDVFCSPTNIESFGETNLSYRLMGKMVPRKMSNGVRMNNIFYKLTMLFSFENEKPVEASIIFKIDNNKTYQKNILKLKRLSVDGNNMEFEPNILPITHDSESHCSIRRVGVKQDTPFEESFLTSPSNLQVPTPQHFLPSPNALTTSQLSRPFDLNDLYVGDLYHETDMSDIYNFQEENEGERENLFF
mmetsp:Transcript_10360/g.15148  ORF Transcript_10360/g.15148 Transcript_10360/m.15148 type:complete len:419 (+) Transcript_10360:170-1426(+)